MPETLPVDRAALADLALARYEAYVAHVTRVLDYGDERHRRFLRSVSVRGLEALRRLPREGEVPPPVHAMMGHWFAVLDGWLAPGAPTDDDEALRVWLDTWPDEILRGLFFTGLRDPHGTDQAVREVAAILPPGWRVVIDMGPDDTVVTAVPPQGHPLSFRRYAGTGRLSSALHGAVASLEYELGRRLEADAAAAARRAAMTAEPAPEDGA